MKTTALATLSLSLAACAPDAALDDATGSVGDAVRARRVLDRAPGVMIAGASADRRFVAYGVGCDGGDVPPRLRLLDAETGRARTLATSWSCTPGAVRFSPDGGVAVFGVDGRVHAADTRSGRVVPVSREGLSGVGVAFSPDGRWFAVASLGDPSQGATLDAWESDLRTRVEVARGAWANPFGEGDAGLRVSPDGRTLAFVGGLTGALPVGSLTLWNHAARTARVVASGVPATSYTLSPDWRSAAFVQGVRPVEGPPTADSLAGDLTVRDLVTGRTHTVERGVTTSALEFARGGAAIVYVTGGFPPGTPAVLKTAAVGGRPAVLDDAVFPMFAPGRSVAVSPAGDAVAWSAAVDPARFVGALRYARLSGTGGFTTVARDAVPGAFGFTRAGALVHLHAPTATFPVATGTLTAWAPATGARLALGSEVAQVGLRVDAARDEVLFFGDYEAGDAVGTLRAWDGRSRAARALAGRAAVMSLQLSPDGGRASFVTLAPAPPGEVPAVTLRAGTTRVASPTVALAEGATSHALDDDGRVFYTTAQGLLSAVAR